MNTETVYDRLAASTYNSAVGGGNAAEVSRRQAHILHQLAPIRSASRTLDFGCGIGRTMPGLLDLRRGEEFILDGCDISQDFVDECRRIHAGLPFRFYRVPGTNEHYDQFKTSAAAPAALPDVDSYDAAYSFSVQTHVDQGGAIAILNGVKRYLRRGGHYYFTLFRLDKQAEGVINANSSPAFRFQNRVTLDTSTFYAADKDRFAFTALEQGELEQGIYDSGFSVVQYMPGGWRGYPADNLHDAYLVRKL